MGLLRTDDGFEFETTRTQRTVRCICRRHGPGAGAGAGAGADSREAVIDVETVEPDAFPTEVIETAARSLWLAGDRLGL